MAERRDDRHPGGQYRPRHRLGVEGVELLEAAAAAGDDDDFRSSLTVGVLLVAAVAPEAVGARFGSLVEACLVYLLIAGVAEALWRWDRGRNLLLFGTMLMIDGLFLAWLTYVTGGVDSPIRNFIVLHLIAVTLLASYRTGLKLAMWHSLLLLVVHYAEQTGVLTAPVSGGNGAEFHQLVAFIVVFWLVALACATFSAINERELRLATG